jgi:hypothetical protein
MNDEEDNSFRMDRTEHLQTSGGEFWLDDFKFVEYGISFEKCSVHNLSPEQMISLVETAVNHLMLNGHRFAIVPHDHQDQREKFVHVK